MDAFSLNKHNQGLRHWLSLRWDGWNFEPQNNDHGTDSEYLSVQEGVLTFEHMLTLGKVGVITNSKVDLQQRVNRWVEKTEPHKGTRYKRPASAKNYVAPCTDVEKKVAEIWQDFLGIEQIGLRDNFFELGGDSLLLIRVKSRIDGVFGINLPLDVLYQHTLHQSLCQQIESALSLMRMSQEAVDDGFEEL